MGRRNQVCFALLGRMRPRSVCSRSAAGATSKQEPANNPVEVPHSSDVLLSRRSTPRLLRLAPQGSGQAPSHASATFIRTHTRPPSTDRSQPRRSSTIRALPPNELICRRRAYWLTIRPITGSFAVPAPAESVITAQRSEEHTSELQSHV